MKKWGPSHFTTQAESAVDLPKPAQVNGGLVLDFVASIARVGESYAVFMTLLQDGKEIGTASDTGPFTGTAITKISELIVALSATPAGISRTASS